MDGLLSLVFQTHVALQTISTQTSEIGEVKKDGKRIGKSKCYSLT
jgi:hypothetical protein